jgi:hypothetical protein
VISPRRTVTHAHRAADFLHCSARTPLTNTRAERE